MRIKKILGVLIIAIFMVCCKNTEDTKNFEKQLLGQWENTALEKEGDTYRFKKLELDSTRWNMRVLVYADAQGLNPLFELEFDGPYEITEKSSTVKESYNGTYGIDNKHLTLLTKDNGTLNALGFTNCNLEYGIRTDISNGCSFIESVSECPVDYDLITIKGGMLYPGKRTENMCQQEGRPTEPGTGLIRVETETLKSTNAKQKEWNYEIKELATDLAFLEGPIWDAANDRLIFSEVNQNRLLQWTAKDGISTHYEPSNYAGGNVFENDSTIISCQGGARQIARIFKDGSSEVLASAYEGKRFNSPNDAVVKSDGTIWFTDPDYGLLAVHGEKAGDFKELAANHIFMYIPKTKEVKSVYGQLTKPNGLVFSKDESILYVGNSEEGDRKIVSFEISENNELSNMEMTTLIDSKTWGVDGLKLGDDGKLYAACGDGVNIFNTEGELIDKIETDFEVTNLCFGENNELFLTGHKALYKVNLK